MMLKITLLSPFFLSLAILTPSRCIATSRNDASLLDSTHVRNHPGASISDGELLSAATALLDVAESRNKHRLSASESEKDKEEQQDDKQSAAMSFLQQELDNADLGEDEDEEEDGADEGGDDDVSLLSLSETPRISRDNAAGTANENQALIRLTGRRGHGSGHNAHYAQEGEAQSSQAQQQAVRPVATLNAAQQGLTPARNNRMRGARGRGLGSQLYPGVSMSNPYTAPNPLMASQFPLGGLPTAEMGSLPASDMSSLYQINAPLNLALQQQGSLQQIPLPQQAAPLRQLAPTSQRRMIPGQAGQFLPATQMPMQQPQMRAASFDPRTQMLALQRQNFNTAARHPGYSPPQAQQQPYYNQPIDPRVQKAMEQQEQQQAMKAMQEASAVASLSDPAVRNLMNKEAEDERKLQALNDMSANAPPSEALFQMNPSTSLQPEQEAQSMSDPMLQMQQLSVQGSDLSPSLDASPDMMSQNGLDSSPSLDPASESLGSAGLGGATPLDDTSAQLFSQNGIEPMSSLDTPPDLMNQNNFAASPSLDDTMGLTSQEGLDSPQPLDDSSLPDLSAYQPRKPIVLLQMSSSVRPTRGRATRLFHGRLRPRTLARDAKTTILPLHFTDPAPQFEDTKTSSESISKSGPAFSLLQIKSTGWFDSVKSFASKVGSGLKKAAKVAAPVVATAAAVAVNNQMGRGQYGQGGMGGGMGGGSYGYGGGGGTSWKAQGAMALIGGVAGLLGGGGGQQQHQMGYGQQQGMYGQQGYNMAGGGYGGGYNMQGGMMQGGGYGQQGYGQHGYNM